MKIQTKILLVFILFLGFIILNNSVCFAGVAEERLEHAINLANSYVASNNEVNNYLIKADDWGYSFFFFKRRR